ncbi:MAG: GlsB/YeaQ/YmgE family stress response membrane protein [Gammaproteobacteria bacterium HGW-Gammaproteobacteria-6]|nr:MAG: GlsB/YeaQ/YmgE family stress response membrane protein [Gammaproteobacteria bacterium HGW-Gammaproteobacteria-6]
MSWIITIIIGGIIGWLASIVMKTNGQMGIIANILVGILGSAMGFWIAGELGISTAGDLARFLVALGGAILLIVILRLLGVFRR